MDGCCILQTIIGKDRVSLLFAHTKNQVGSHNTCENSCMTPLNDTPLTRSNVLLCLGFYSTFHGHIPNDFSFLQWTHLLNWNSVLFKRKSSEDYIFAILFVINALVRDIDVVKSDINPSWEKGPIQNIKEFKNMIDCCGPQIRLAMSDPQSKKAIDLLNAVDLRDQVGSYRVIVSNETPQLEEFTLCILQQNNCFNCNSPILEKPKVPLLQQWRGKPLDADGARQILIGHLDHPDAAAENTQKLPWSWKIVVGANPAYDAFPMQHQIFYPTGGTGTSKSKSLWYDPVFCVGTFP